MVSIKAQIQLGPGYYYDTYGEKDNENIMKVREEKKEIHKLKEAEQDAVISKQIIRMMDFDGTYGIRYFQVGARAKTEIFDGKECYKLSEGFGKNHCDTWIDKETMFPIRKIMEFENERFEFVPNIVDNIDYKKKQTETCAYDTFYKVEYGVVTDEDVKMPSTEGYTVITAEW